MKNLKHVFTVLLLLCTTVVCAENVTIDGIAYSVNAETKQAEVVSNGWGNYSGDIVVPDEIIYNAVTYRVTSVGNEAFFWCSGLTSITIPNSVTSIGEDAFSGCSGLTSIGIPNSVTSIGRGAFSGCSGLTNIEIPNSVTSIGLQAFAYCSGLTNILIPNSVTSIGENVFENCFKLESIIVETGNPKYDSRKNCNAIIETESNTLVVGCKNTTIPNGIVSIRDYAFSDCSGLTSIEIPNSVTSFGEGAFSGCSGLTSIEIPNSVTSIGGEAFYRCFGLTSIEIPNSVTSIGDAVFSGCSNLESIIVASGNPKYDSRENCNAIIETSTNTLILGCNNSTIPNTVTSIGEDAFCYCSGLTNVIIPNSVTSIGHEAFYDCSGLTSIEIPSSVISIGASVFYGCFNLTNIAVPDNVISVGHSAFESTPWYNNLPAGVIYIGNVLYKYKGMMPENTSIVVKDGTTMISERAFSYSNELVGIEIPSSVTSIGDEAFYNCSGLTSIEIPNSVTSIGDEAFSGCSKLESIIVASGNPKYDSRENCNAIIETSTNTLILGCNNSTIPNGVVTVGDRAFYNCSGLTNITIPSSVTSIGYGAFWSCSGLTSIEIPNSVISIGEWAFCYCTGLTSIEIPSSVTYIGGGAFNGTAWYNNLPGGVVYVGRILYGYKGEMPSNTSIVVKDGTIMICGSAFDGCSGLANIEIPNSVVIIGGDAFYGTYWYNNQPDGVVYAGNVLYDYKGDMPENTIIVIKDGTISITDGAFSEMEEIIGVEIPNSVKYIGDENFDNTAISSIEIPEGVESLGEIVFGGCYALTDVVIPSSVKSIGEYAFAYCPALTSIKSYIAKEDLFVPGNDVFYDVDKSKCTLYVPYGAKDVYASTAGWSDFLNICEFDATAIDDVQVEDTVNPNLNVIYDLRGNRLTNTENLERGIYIINGQRVLIK